MGSRGLVWRIVWLAAVVVGTVVAMIAWREGLPAISVVAALCALGASAALLRVRTAGGAPITSKETDSPRVEQEARRRTLQAFLDQAPTPLVTLEPGGRLVAVNRAGRRLFHTDNVLHAPDPLLVRAIAETGPEVRRTVGLTVDGLRRTYALSVAEIVGAAGALRLAALTDIEAEIQAAEAAALKELLQVLSHEIMNSLTPLASLAQSASELLADGSPDDIETARESVAVIARRSDGLHRFVTAYRQLARLPAPEPRQVSLAALLAEAGRLFEGRWGARGVRLLAEPLKVDILIRLDPDLTSQALLSLLTNAAEAAVAADGAKPWVKLSARPLGAGAAIVVEDSGPGVAPDLASEIFRPFFTTKPDGNGIGLALARQAVVSQGGQLVLDQGTAGARFTIAL